MSAALDAASEAELARLAIASCVSCQGHRPRNVPRRVHAEKVRLCVLCLDGTTLTSVAMADWLLSDYVGGNNAEEACDQHAISMQSACNQHAISMPSEEACDLLATRKRLAGVERRTAPEQLECWVTNGCLADVTPVHAKSLWSTPGWSDAPSSRRRSTSRWWTT